VHPETPRDNRERERKSSIKSGRCLSSDPPHLPN
jgi:hypothetical protein